MDASDANDQRSPDAAPDGGCAGLQSTVAGTYRLRLHSRYTRFNCQLGSCDPPQQDTTCDFCDESQGTEDGDATLTLTAVYGGGFGIQIVGSLDAPSVDLAGFFVLHNEQYGIAPPPGDAGNLDAAGFGMSVNGSYGYAWDAAWKGQKIRLDIWTPPPAERTDPATNDEVVIDIDTATGRVTSFARTSHWTGLAGNEAITTQTGTGQLVCGSD